MEKMKKMWSDFVVFLTKKSLFGLPVWALLTVPVIIIILLWTFVFNQNTTSSKLKKTKV